MDLDNKRMTLSDVAKLAGTCRTTLYRYLKDDNSVNPKTKLKIEKALKETGYKKNTFAATLASGKIYKVLFLCANDPGLYFWKQMTSGVEKASDFYYNLGMQVQTMYYHTSQIHDYTEKLKQICEEDHYDGIVIFPIALPETEHFIQTMIQKGRVVITVNRDVPGSSRHLYIGCDYYVRGRLGGEILAKLCRQKRGTILLFGNIYEGYRDDQDSQSDTGFLESLKEHLSDKVNNLVVVQCKEQNLYGIATSYLKLYPDTIGIGNLNPECMPDLLKAIEEHQFSTRPNIVTFDIYSETIHLLRDGKIDAVVSQDLYHQGYNSISHMYHLLTGTDNNSDDVRHCRVEAVFWENLMYYL